MSDTENPPPQRRMGLAMSAIAWIIVLGLLVLWFNEWLGERNNPNREPVTLTDGDTREVTLRPNHQHHYVVSGYINRQPVTFMLDTGATDVVVPAQVADRIGLKPGYPTTAMTANGVVDVFSTRLDSVEIGGIRLHSIPASINPAMREPVVLLGMSALRQIEFTQRGDVLILRQ